MCFFRVSHQEGGRVSGSQIKPVYFRAAWAGTVKGHDVFSVFTIIICPLRVVLIVDGADHESTTKVHRPPPVGTPSTGPPIPTYCGETQERNRRIRASHSTTGEKCYSH